MGIERVKADILDEMGYLCVEQDCVWSICHNVGLAANSHFFSRVSPCNESQADGRVLSDARRVRGTGFLKWHFKSSVLK